MLKNISKLESLYSRLHQPLQQYFSCCDFQLWPLTLTLKDDLGSVKRNQCAVCLGQVIGDYWFMTLNSVHAVYRLSAWLKVRRTSMNDSFPVWWASIRKTRNMRRSRSSQMKTTKTLRVSLVILCYFLRRVMPSIDGKTLSPWKLLSAVMHLNNTTTHRNNFVALLSGTTRVSRCQKRTSGLMVQGPD